jgi:hypothetical protein
MSVVANGKVMHNLSGQELRNRLNTYLVESKEEMEDIKIKDLKNAKETA